MSDELDKYSELDPARLMRQLTELAARIAALEEGGGGGGSISVQNDITAHPGGGKPEATVLTGNYCRVTTAASESDSVILRAATAGDYIILANDGGSGIAVYASGDDTVDGNEVGVDGLASLNAGGRVLLYCMNNGNWTATETLGNLNGVS